MSYGRIFLLSLVDLGEISCDGSLVCSGAVVKRLVAKTCPDGDVVNIAVDLTAGLEAESVVIDHTPVARTCTGRVGLGNAYELASGERVVTDSYHGTFSGHLISDGEILVKKRSRALVVGKTVELVGDGESGIIVFARSIEIAVNVIGVP